MLALNIWGLLLEQFKPEGLREALKQAVDDYQYVWSLPKPGQG